MIESGDSFVQFKPVLKEAKFSEWKPGDVIANGLEIRELIGKGGMGAVWRVHHREWNRELAVKMPLPALVGSPTARDRFLREAETWIDLGVHPHIVQCWFVKDIAGLPCLFLDFLTGGSLKQWLVAGHVRPGQWKRILEIGIQSAEGLAYSHSRGVVHRDVKPANLLIRGDERVCVTDFGIVKTANDKEEEPVKLDLSNLPKDMSLTGTGAFLGTPQYGAPEQWGAAEGVDHAADIYALGITIYEMCCGRRPFDADNDNTPPEVLIASHLDKKPPDPREFYKDVPSELAHIVLLCLEKDPKRRPHDMERLKGALTSIYERLTNSPYRGVGTVPKEQRADILNNRGVSLHSLSKPEEARDVWQLGLRIESGHPECLFNLTQLELRAGRIDGGEGLRRLRQAKAGLPLALMCIEEGFPNEAIDVLAQLKPEAEGLAPGPVQRALGDAQMYAKQYYAAEKAYRSALGAMPADTFSHERKRLASLGKRSLQGKILFPSDKPSFHVNLSDPTTKVVMSQDSEGLLGLSARAATYWSVDEQCVEHRQQRAEGATAPTRVSCGPGFLLCEDETAFELRRLPHLGLLGRKSGRILSFTRNLRKLFVKEAKGCFVFDVAKSQLKRIIDAKAGQTPLLAQFGVKGERLCLLLSDGRIGQPDESGKIQVESWPEKVEDYETACCLALGSRTSHLYIGHSSGLLQALDFESQTINYTLQFRQGIKEILGLAQSRKLVVRLESGFVVLDHLGRVLLAGKGPVAVDYERARLICVLDRTPELYSFTPFRRLRVWKPLDEAPTEIHLARDGKRAVSQCGNRSFDVWEVDEDNRVFERSFLLSPGKSFAEIASASNRFMESFQAAQSALSNSRLSASYRHLQRARSVQGYAQRPEALDLNWKLLEQLRRDRLESVWERSSIENSHAEYERPESILLLGEGNQFLLSFGPKLELYQDDGNETTLTWSDEFKSPVVMQQVRSRDRRGAPETVFLLTADGEGLELSLKGGEKKALFSLGKGTLTKVVSIEDGFLYRTESGEIGSYGFSRGVVGKWQGVDGEGLEIYQWKPHAALLALGDELLTLDLQARKPDPKRFTLPRFEIDSKLCYTGRHPQGHLLYLGFENGTLVICDAVKGKPIFILDEADGPITGFFMIEMLSAGICSTRAGKLCFWDLHSSLVLEEFSAHREAVALLESSPSGRYLLTAGNEGQVRLWETSWTATEDQGEVPLDWLVSAKKNKDKPTNKLGRFFGFGR